MFPEWVWREVPRAIVQGSNVKSCRIADANYACCAVPSIYSGTVTGRLPWALALSPACYWIAFLRNRNELLITETELKLMATAAIIGESSRPKKG